MKENNSQLLQARVLAKDGKYIEASKHFADYLDENDKDNPQILLELGFALLLAGDEEGAVRIYQALILIMENLKKIPSKILILWEKYSNLIAGTRKKLALAGATALILSSTACGSQPTQSAHKYSGGVLRPVMEVSNPPSLTSTKPAHITTAPAAPASEVTEKEKQQALDTIEKQLNDAFYNKPHSAHRYSGGVYFNQRQESIRKQPSYNRTKPVPEKKNETDN